MTRNFIIRGLTALALSLSMAGLTGCGDKKTDAGGRAKIRTGGSTTLFPIVQGWAEKYDAADVSVSAGGSSAGLKDLEEGRVDIANSSKPLKPAEIEAMEKKTGKKVIETIVGYDALAIFVHKDNPATQISLGQLNQLYSSQPKDGKAAISKWEEVGAGSGDIKILGREHSSGTGEYFQEAICGKDAEGKKIKFREGISELNSAAAVISTLGNTVSGIGYDALAFQNEKVKALSVSKAEGAEAVPPSIDGARSGTYPLARKLYLYSLEPSDAALKAFLAWTVSDEGQKVVAEKGGVTLK